MLCVAPPLPPYLFHFIYANSCCDAASLNAEWKVVVFLLKNILGGTVWIVILNIKLVWLKGPRNVLCVDDAVGFVVAVAFGVTAGVIVICILRGQHQKDSFHFMFENASWLRMLCCMHTGHAEQNSKSEINNWGKTRKYFKEILLQHINGT